MKYFVFIAALFLSLTPFLQAQDSSETPYGLGELEAYSVFSDAYKSQDYELAIDYGKWIIETKPRTISGYDGFSLELQFERMINVYVQAAEETSDPTQSEEYLAEAESVLQEAFETFDEDEIDLYEWNLRKGRFYQEHYEDLEGASLDDAVEGYEAMYEMDAERFSEEADGYYARVLLTAYEDQGEQEKALEFIDETEQYASGDLQATIDEVRESFFDNPEERIEFLESRVDATEGEEKEEILGSLVDLYEETNQAEEGREAALELYELNDNYENARRVASIYLSAGEYQNALEYLQVALDKAGSEADESEILMEMAETHQQLDNHEQARDFAQRSVDLGENPGEAYLRISSIYASAVSQCSGGEALGRDDRTVYWLVLDYLEQAKEADPSLASNVNNQIASYEEAMPTEEDKFFNDWETGNSFTIDASIGECYSWINETTTVR